ncbi:DNA primase catalytic subunit PriS [Vulcanisaeta thermophila]|uniref:DNA primase catalytic subunit PriS n=1 Tax=Vulcanisaeta thermophila TaxID=867917 RepID=UPI000B306BAB|nr:DNA primase catalytic subunit PriS [Vulcanisaeta thermophila]
MVNMLSEDFAKLMKVLFRNYYRSANLEVSNIELREFGFQFFDKEGMVRHVSFKNAQELKQYLVNNVPAHVYYSTALYRDPSNQDMDQKGWLGADLVFDIDGDHLETESCRATELMTLECLGDALEEVEKLIDVLTDDFGFTERDLRVYFSGHRGFHVHIEGDEVKRLSDNERREIIDYLLMREFNTEHLIRRLRTRDVVLIDPKIRGVGGRVAEALHDIDAELLEELQSKRDKVPRNVMGRLSSLNGEISRKLAVHVDEVVTMDIHRLIRMHNSLHGKTGLRVAELGLGDLERGVEYVIDLATPFKKGSLTIRLLRRLPVRRVMGVDVAGDEGSIVKVPINIGIYLVMTGWGEFLD